MISGFNGNYRYMSNFFPGEIEFEGLKYPTVEHAYQAAKTENDDLRKHISLLPSPSDAKKQGRLLVLREDWDDIKLPIMKSLLRKKFGNHSDLALQLVHTGSEELVETNYWHDNFWGNCICNRHKLENGENHLGRLLMEQREIIREAVNAGVVF